MKIKENKKSGFTLSETLITLAIIGVVAALTLPSLVKKYQTLAWSTAQDQFKKKLNIAMQMMNTNDLIEGYDSTESFLNKLKNYIGITQICTGSNITGCFPSKVIWSEGEDPVEITSSAVTYTDTDDQDWAETVGVRFTNGVEALIAYDKNCTGDPLNNQFSASECIGIIYDVSGDSNPNTNGKDLLSINVSKLGGTTGCVYTTSSGTCFSQILTSSTGYSAMTKSECKEAVSEGTLGIKYCGYSSDYWAGAVKACGGVDNMPTQSQLTELAQELYGTSSISSSGKTSGLTLDTDAASAFISAGSSWFYVWSGEESSSTTAYYRSFRSTDTGWYSSRNLTNGLAVCVAN